MTSAVVAINAAMDVAKDLAEGVVSPSRLDAEAVTLGRELVGMVVGSDDPLWALQLEVARGVLAAGGVAAGELAEWLAVARAREPEPVLSSNQTGDFNRLLELLAAEDEDDDA